MSTPLTINEHRPAILLVDDDTDLLQLLSIRLHAAGYQVMTAKSAELAMNHLEIFRPHVVITDVQMGGIDGMALFEHIQRTMPALPVIIFTAHGTIPAAVAATQRGAFGYLTKPFDSKTLLDLLSRAVKVSGSAGDLPVPHPASWQTSIITRNAAMIDLLAKAILVAQSDASVLILGDSGTGKELFAHVIHQASRRKSRPFLAINCAAIPEHLLESELFGHAKGAFTGAVREHKGLFQAAEGGTVFLDEIGDMPLMLQAKLLRVLQERQLRPVGSTHTVQFDVRIISATHRDLPTEITAGHFREDIYYRLNVVKLSIPPLSQRREDIPLLANHFLTQISRKYDKNINGFTPDTLDMLVAAAWPGNVRQLLNVVEQSVALCTTPLITVGLVQEAINDAQLISLEDAKREFERDYIIRVLKITAGNVSQAAHLSKRNRTEFYKLLQRHQLDPSTFKIDVTQ